MINPIKVVLTLEELRTAYGYGKKLPKIIGKSNIYTDPKDRAMHSPENKVIGIGIGEAAGNKQYFSFAHYIQCRDFRMGDPYKGDGGIDTLGWMVDYKASDTKGRPLKAHTLIVAPKERHKGNVYVQILVDCHGFPPEQLPINMEIPDIYIMGWAYEGMLPDKVGTDSRFPEKYSLPLAELFPPDTLTRNKIIKIPLPPGVSEIPIA